MIAYKNIREQEKVEKKTNFYEFGLTVSQLGVYKFLLMHKEHYRYVYPAISYIAFKTKCHPRTVHRALQKLKECGLLTWLSRKRQKKTNMYFIPDHLLESETYKKLWAFITTSLSVGFYFMLSNRATRENVILKKKGLYNSSIIDSKREDFSIENWLYKDEVVEEMTEEDKLLLKLFTSDLIKKVYG